MEKEEKQNNNKSLNQKIPFGDFLVYNMIMEMNQKIPEKKRFSIIARVRSANHALRGLGVLIKTTHNFWGHLFFTILAIYLGFILKISHFEWIALVFAVGLVLIVEALNTAFEVDIDLTSPDFNPYARDIKDVAAGAVLLSVLVACVIGLIIFMPKIIILCF
ncbi:MAG: diacylglycerol kinase family protein [Candidatus Pacebacteria bacterium]|nr:diacylglycerol kinase family protein [Candidatus Paceibacterota bacterium]